MSIEDKLYTVKYCPDECSHLNPDNELCKECKVKICTKICPANVYEWFKEESKMIVRFENCLECGACKITCEKKCLQWEYPRGTKGVMFKLG